MANFILPVSRGRLPYVVRIVSDKNGMPRGQSRQLMYVFCHVTSLRALKRDTLNTSMSLTPPQASRSLTR
jgi:hypothetical protein